MSAGRNGGAGQRMVDEIVLIYFCKQLTFIIERELFTAVVLSLPVLIL